MLYGRRGRYTNLSQETRDEIAEYALQYGEQVPTGSGLKGCQ